MFHLLSGKGWRQKTQSLRVPIVLWLRPRGLSFLLDTIALCKGLFKEIFKPNAPIEKNTVVLVVCANFNHEEWLEDCIDSMMNQTFKNWRMMVVDDQSTDGSLVKLKALAERDRRIQVIALSENSGAYVARNTGVSASNDDWTHVTFIDPDDVAVEDWLRHVLGKLGSRSGIVRPMLKRTNVKLEKNKRIYYGHCPSLISRDIWEAMGGFANRRVAGDSEFIQRVQRAAELGRAAIRYSTKVSQLCRVHDGNSSRQNAMERKLWLEERRRICQKAEEMESLRIKPSCTPFDWIVS